MPRPDPALLRIARYPFRCLMEPRFSDLDSNRHLNNVALMSILEDARVRFHRVSGFQHGPDWPSSMVASLSAEFVGQAFFPDPLEIGVATARIGRTSYRISQVATQNERLVLYAEAVLVCMGDKGPVAIPDAFRAGLQDWMLKP